MPRPGEDRSDVGGAAQFNNIGPVPLSASQPTDPSRFPNQQSSRAQSGIRLANRSDLESFFLTSISGVSLLLFRGTRGEQGVIPNGLLPLWISQT